MITRRTLAGAILAAVLVSGAVGAAAEETARINTLGGEGVAIRGYDPVAYFVSGGPRLGRPDITAQHGGATWRFADAANRAAFVADPERYVPAYGGYCAYGVARGVLVKIEPEAWSIRDGRLYLNYDLPVRETWLGDPAGYIVKADDQWPALVN